MVPARVTTVPTHRRLARGLGRGADIGDVRGAVEASTHARWRPGVAGRGVDGPAVPTLVPEHQSARVAVSVDGRTADVPLVPRGRRLGGGKLGFARSRYGCKNVGVGCVAVEV